MCHEEKIKHLKKIDGIGDKTAQVLIDIDIIECKELMFSVNDICKEAESLKERIEEKFLEGNSERRLPSKESLVKFIKSANKGDWQYSQAKKRYHDLIVRTFQKLLYYCKYDMLNNENHKWRNDNCQSINIDSEINWNKFENFIKIFNEDQSRKRLKLLTKFRNDYNKKTIVEKRNRYLGKMEKIKLSQYKFKNDFLSYFENNILSYKIFQAKYHKDGEKSKRKCAYCGINEEQIEKLNSNEKLRTKRIYTRGQSMEVDQIDPNEGYNDVNIKLACYWCNNAKTDEFNYDEFRTISDGIRKVWNKRIEDYNKQPDLAKQDEIKIIPDPEDKDKK